MHGFPSPQVRLAWLGHVTACTLGGGLPGARVPSSLQWAVVSVPSWPGAVGPHTVCPSLSAWQPAQGVTLWEELFW